MTDTQTPPLGAMYGVENEGFETAVCCDALDANGNRITFIITPQVHGFMCTVIFANSKQLYSGALIPSEIMADIVQALDTVEESNEIQA